MPLLQVRDIPQDLYESLSQMAKQDNRSIAQETIVLLRKALKLDQEIKLKRKAVLNEISKLELGDTSKFADPVELIREDRDR